MASVPRKAGKVLVANVDDHDLHAGITALGLELLLSSTEEQFLGMVPGVDAVIMSAAHLTGECRRSISESSPNLRWLHFLNAGVDTIQPGDFGAGVSITYSPGAGATTVAEHGLTLMLALSRALPLVLRKQHHRSWDYGLGGKARSLQGRRVTVIGFGHIGKALARLLEPFDMDVITVTRSGGPYQLARENWRMDEADACLRTSDYIVIAAPLTEQTKGYFDEARFAQVKSGAFLINLSRGGIVDLAALQAALEDGRLAGAALDVTDPEPLPPGHPIWGAPNLLISPHMAAGGANAIDRHHLARLTVENCRRFIQGQPLLHQVLPAAG